MRLQKAKTWVRIMACSLLEINLSTAMGSNSRVASECRCTASWKDFLPKMNGSDTPDRTPDVE